MGNSYYDAAEVDEMLKQSAVIIDTFADTIKEQQQDIENLRKELNIAKSAAAGNVTLEKVAGLKHESAQAFAEFLADRAFISSGDVEKYASAMAKDPEALRAFATQAIELSIAPASQGYGIKQASKTLDTAAERERQLWLAAAGLTA